MKSKSHSVISNFKLTMLCLMGVLCVTIFWLGVGILKSYESIGIIAVVSGAILSLISFGLITKFTR